MDFFDVVQGIWLILCCVAFAVYRRRNKDDSFHFRLRSIAVAMVIWWMGYWVLMFIQNRLVD